MCTGNICRSPMAAVLLSAELAARELDGRVASAGTMAWPGPATDLAVAVMRERGLDISGHRARPLTSALIDHADLVLGMTRDHLGRVLNLAPGARDRVFLLGELVRLGTAVGARRPGEDVRDWTRCVARTRPDARVAGRGEDEVPDPLGEPIEVYRSTAARLQAELRAIADLLAG